MSTTCAARQLEQTDRFPVKSRKIQRRFERWWLLLCTHGDAIWLQRRPDTGIWAGLYAPPLFDSEDALRALLGARADQLQAWAPVAHSLTHRELQLLPNRLEWQAEGDPDLPGQWFDWPQAMSLGLPAPVRTLLQTHCDQPLPQ